MRKILIIGGGFGGLKAAKELSSADVEITLFDRCNHHLFQPLLYQVATSALASRDIAYPIREILKNQKNTTVILDEAVRVIPDQKKVEFSSGRSVDYDELVIAVGARHSYFGHPEWEKYAPGLKTLDDSIHIRQKILLAYEHAEACQSPEEIKKFLSFVIVGGGPTGVELAGAIAEIAQHTMLKNFRRIDPTHTKVFLVEGEDCVLPMYPKGLSERAREDLEKIGVTVMTNTKVTKIDKKGVTLGDDVIETQNVFWAAGNQASTLLKSLDVPLDRQNRVLVNDDLSVPGHPDIFVIGDAAHLDDLPGVASVAIQQGEYVGKLLSGGKKEPFHYKDMGMMSTIGKAKAVALIKNKEFKGIFAWLLWIIVHIMFLIGFRNKVMVMIEWFFWYITGGRSSRLIYEELENGRD